MYGELVPLGGGDPIPLLKKRLIIGRRETCDIVLRFANVSGQHCELTADEGYWFVSDKGSRNGTKVNGLRVATMRKRLDPGDTLSVAKYKYEFRYSPVDHLAPAVRRPPKRNPIRDICRKACWIGGLKRRKS